MSTLKIDRSKFFFIAMLCLTAEYATLVNAEESKVLSKKEVVVEIRNPTEILEKVSKETMRQLQEKRDLLETNQEVLRAIIRKELFPYIDRARMARWALGKHWRRATREQRIAFAREFETLLLRTYATALLKYIDAEIVFLPVKLMTGDRQALVRSQVNIASSPQPIAINYRLYLGKNAWRVYDISIEDVSLIASYRTTFSREIRHRGVAGLIESLHQRNNDSEKEKTGEADVAT